MAKLKKKTKQSINSITKKRVKPGRAGRDTATPEGGVLSGDTAINNPGTNSSQSGSSSSLANSILQETAAEDPIAVFVQRRWKEIATLVAIVLAVIYGKQAFESTRFNAQQRSADVLLQLQEEVDSFQNAKSLLTKAAASTSETATDVKTTDVVDLNTVEPNTVEPNTAKDKEKKEQEDQALQTLETSKTKISELINVLSQESSPYKELASVYQNIIGEDVAGGSLGDTSVGSMAPSLSKSSTYSNLSLMPELQIFSKALQGLKSQDSAEAAYSSLRELVESGNFLSVPALVLLVKNGGASIEVAKPLAANLLSRQPEQSDLLRQSLPQLF